MKEEHTLLYHTYSIPKRCKLKSAVTFSNCCSLDPQEGLASGSIALQDNVVDKQVKKNGLVVNNRSALEV